MFYQLLHSYETAIVNYFGYDRAVRVEQVLFGISMICVGMIIMSFFSATFVLRLHSLEDFGKSKVKILRVDNGKESSQIVSIRDIKDAFMQVMILSFSPLLTIKRFTERDARRTKRFVVITLIIMILLIVFGIITTWSVLRPV